jgi:hypothetical protein
MEDEIEHSPSSDPELVSVSGSWFCAHAGAATSVLLCCPEVLRDASPVGVSACLQRLLVIKEV